ncbi:MAG: homoserine O-acetyltransferase [Rhodothalassiaceae bacterium]
MPFCDHDHQIERFDQALALDSGAVLPGFQLAYASWGQLSPRRDNAVAVFHALSGDQYVCGRHPLTGRPGWWERMVGPGRPIDTDRFFVVCVNVPGGCMGSTGPGSLNPATGRRYGPDWPVLTITDMVRAQQALFARLGIDRFHAVIGGSMGGMQALSYAALYPQAVERVIALAAPFQHSAFNIGFHELGRQAIMADPAWAGGHYDPPGPVAGLAVARIAAHLTYLGQDRTNARFGRALQDKQAVSFSMDQDFQIESYLRHQGRRFTERFDANSYLAISRGMDYFDLGHGEALATRFRGSPARFELVSFSSDWLYPTAAIRPGAETLAAAGLRVRFTELLSDFGHDAFLLEVPALDRLLADGLAAAPAAGD